MLNLKPIIMCCIVTVLKIHSKNCTRGYIVIIIIHIVIITIFIIIIIIIIIYDNLFFVGIIEYLKIPQTVFRAKKLIKVNYKPSNMKFLKDTFQQSFKFHNYLVKKTYMHICKYKYKDAHKCTHTRMHT